jgi:phage-related protein
MEPKLRTKLVQGIGNLAAIPEYRTEPHVKHFSLERYAALYEYRARMRIMVRVIFTLDGDRNIILLHPMVKKRDRNTMQALETSLRMLDRLKQGEASLVEYTGKEVVG